MLCQFLLYSKVNQLYVYIYSHFFGFPSIQVTTDHEQIFLYYIVCSLQLSILYIVSIVWWLPWQLNISIVYICQSQSPFSRHHSASSFVVAFLIPCLLMNLPVPFFLHRWPSFPDYSHLLGVALYLFIQCFHFLKFFSPRHTPALVLQKPRILKRRNKEKDWK